MMLSKRRRLSFQTRILRFTLRILGLSATVALLFSCVRDDAVKAAANFNAAGKSALTRKAEVPPVQNIPVKNLPKENKTGPGTTYDPGKTIHPVAYGTPATDYRNLTVPDTSSK